MEYIIPAILGYLLGSVSPSALLGKIKKVNLRKSGTGNLGATNTALLMGKKLGFAVMFFDIFKGALAVIITKLIFFETAALSSLIAGAFATIGHMYPFYLKFKGGKGLATYGGMILAYDPLLFLILFAIGVICMLVFNYCVALTVSASTLFPFAVAIRRLGSEDFWYTVILASLISALVIFRHRKNIFRAIKKEEPSTRFFLKNLFKKSTKEDIDKVEAVTAERQKN